jgi:hypothetical protein
METFIELLNNNSFCPAANLDGTASIFHNDAALFGADSRSPP